MTYSTSGHHDFKRFCAVFPELITPLRRFSLAEMRKMADIIKMPHAQARRAFSIGLYQRTTYLKLMADPQHEPDPLARFGASIELATREYEKRHPDYRRDGKKKVCDPLLLQAKQPRKPPQKTITVNRARLQPAGRQPISRYKF